MSAIATGNWGCGAFGGDLRLKGISTFALFKHFVTNFYDYTSIHTDCLSNDCFKNDKSGP